MNSIKIKSQKLFYNKLLKHNEENTKEEKKDLVISALKNNKNLVYFSNPKNNKTLEFYYLLVNFIPVLIFYKPDKKNNYGLWDNKLNFDLIYGIYIYNYNDYKCFDYITLQEIEKNIDNQIETFINTGSQYSNDNNNYLNAMYFLYKNTIINNQIFTSVKHVSQSGMSRDITPYLTIFNEYTKLNDIVNITYYCNCINLFSPSSNRDALKIGGCGMDMTFHLVYTLSSRLYSHIEFINKKDKRGGYFIDNRNI